MMDKTEWLDKGRKMEGAVDTASSQRGGVELRGE